MITTTKPTVVPATDEKKYDKIWVRRIVIQAPNPNGKVNANVNLVAYREVEAEIEGKKVIRRELAQGEGIEFRLLDVYSQADYNPEQITPLINLLDEATDAERIGILATVLLNVVESNRC